MNETIKRIKHLIKKLLGENGFAKIERQIRAVYLFFVRLPQWLVSLFTRCNIPLTPNENQLIQLKDSHAGERCFIIGSGPSLTFSDLMRLNGEQTFVSNSFYRCLSQVDFRPKYYCITDINAIYDEDDSVVREKLDIFERVPCEIKFFSKDLLRIGGIKTLSRVVWFRQKSYLVVGKSRKMMYDMRRCITSNYTVTHAMILIAAYMGFREIYLLGIDNNYKKDGSYFIQNYNNPDKVYPEFQKDKVTELYEYTEEFTKQIGVKVYNATRGGCLEAFKRVDFDEIAGI